MGTYFCGIVDLFEAGSRHFDVIYIISEHHQLFTFLALSKMTLLRKYQAIVVTSLLLYIAWIVIPMMSAPLPMAYDEAFQWRGYGSPPWAYDLLSDARYVWFSLVLKLVVSLGLVLLLSWARWLMLVMVVFTSFTTLLSGLVIGFAVDTVIGYFICLSEGAILALAFLSPIAQMMKQDR